MRICGAMHGLQDGNDKLWLTRSSECLLAPTIKNTSKAMVRCRPVGKS